MHDVTPGRTRRDFAIAAALAALAAVTFCGVLGNGFVNLDDDLYVYANPVVQSGLSFASLKWAFQTLQTGEWYPLTWLSLELDSQLFGLSPAGYHATNLALHVVNSMLVFLVLRWMTGAVGRSACVAALFAVHPLHVESVAWISDRKDLLAALLLLTSLAAWQSHAKSPSGWRYAVAAVAFCLSLMAKTSGLTWPLVLLLLDGWPLRRWPTAAGALAAGHVAAGAAQPRPVSWLIAEKLPFFLAATLFIVVSVMALGIAGALEYGQTISAADKLLNVPVNYVAYLWRTVWPVGLAVFYPHTGGGAPLATAAAATGLLAVLTGLALRFARRRPYLLVGWLWFVVALLPTSGLLQIGGHATADRYMYLPLIGLLVAVCWSVAELAQRTRWPRWAPAVLCGAAVLACAWASIRQVRYWHDDLALWEHTLTVAPRSPTACCNYGLALDQAGRTDEAEQWFRAALEIDPGFRPANLDLGILLGRQGRHQEAAQYFEAVVRKYPFDPIAHDNLGLAAEMQGDLDKAIEHYGIAAEVAPHSPRLYQRLWRVLQRREAEQQP